MDAKQFICSILLLSFFVFISGFSGCRSVPENFKINSVTITSLSGQHNFSVEIAENDAERAKGLMFRENLDNSSGMFFIYSDKNTPGFWMRNTLIPLDMIFIDADLRVVDINKNSRPCNEGHACPIYYSKAPAKYILEINGGLSDKLNIITGDKVKIAG